MPIEKGNIYILPLARKITEDKELIFDIAGQSAWCLGNIKKPPHFPVDRIIQQKLNEQAKLRGLPKLQLLPWTQFKDETHYIKVINHARALKITSPAKLELKLFQRR
jgi:hypothetical protein